jgi:hypothetical protein
MSMMAQPEATPERRTVIERQLTQALEAAVNERKPVAFLRLPWGRLDIKEHSRPLRRFLDQAVNLGRIKALWPNVAIQHPTEGTVWTPVDLQEGPPSARSSMQSIETSIALAESQGFSLAMFSIDETRTHFIRGLAQSLWSRLKAQVPEIETEPLEDQALILGPPNDVEVNVHTNGGGHTVVYCAGYFKSTALGFGRSSPAVRSIDPGNYLFGLSTPSGHDFDNTLWSIAGDTDVPLDKP